MIDTLLSYIFVLLDVLKNSFVVLSVFIEPYKSVILAIEIIYLLIMRVAIENQVQIKHHFKFNWGLFAASILLLILAYFIKIPSLSTTMFIIPVIIWIIYFLYNSKNGSYAAKAVIRSGSVVYEQNYTEPTAFDKFMNGENAEGKEQKRESIRRILSTKKMQWRYGIPIFSNIYKWKMSATATNEQFSRVVSQLMKFYPEYVWTGNRHGKFYQIMGAPTQVKAMIVPFDKAISDELPWYIIPLGCRDTSSKKAAHQTPYVWELHKDEIDHKCLSRIVRLDNAPMGFVVGATGGGKALCDKNKIIVKRLKNNSAQTNDFIGWN